MQKGSSSFLTKHRNNRFVSLNSFYLKPKALKKQQVSAKKKQKQANRSTSFKTVKKIDLSNLKKKSNQNSRLSSSRFNLNQTLKKQKKKPKQSINLSDQFSRKYRSEIPHKSLSISTPKFGQSPYIQAQNLTLTRLNILFQLQSLQKQFTDNLGRLSLICLKRLSPHKQNLSKCIELNKELLDKQWLLIKKNCSKVNGQKDNQVVNGMVWEWKLKKDRIRKIQENLEKAFQLLLL